MRKRILLAALLCGILTVAACSTSSQEQTAETTPTATEAAATAENAALGENEATASAPETDKKEPLYIPESGMAKAEFCDEMKAKNSLSALSENYDSVVITLTGTEENGESISLKTVISEFEGEKAASFTYDFDDLKITMFATDTYAVQSSLKTSDFNSDISIIHPRYKGKVLEKQFITLFPEDAYLCDIREEEGVYVVEMGTGDEERYCYYLNPEDFSLIKITGKHENSDATIDFRYNAPTALDMTAYDNAFGGEDLVSVTFCFDPDTEEEYSCTLKLNKNTLVFAYAEELMQYFYKDKEMTEKVIGISGLDGATIYANSEKTGEIVYTKPE